MLSNEATSQAKADSPLSLYHLLDQEVLANPYPLYHTLRTQDPVHWDPFLCAWVVTRYSDVVTVLHRFSANRTPTPEQLTSLGLEALTPFAKLMVRQMLFVDPPMHTRLRGLATAVFTNSRIEGLRAHIQDIVDALLDRVLPAGRMDVLADFANLLPATVTAEMLGVPVSDRDQLKTWSADFAEMLGNFQHNPDRAMTLLRSLNEMVEYFRARIREQAVDPRDGLVHALASAEIDGDRLTEDEVIANLILTMVGGQETTTNLIGNGILALLRNPDEFAKLRANESLVPSAVEELLRYESPTQHTCRTAPEDLELGGKRIRKRQPVMAMLAAANRDPERFPHPDRLDLARTDNRHLAFGFGAHFCFGAPLARIEGQIAYSTILRRLRNLTLEPQQIVWRPNLALRGLNALWVRFEPARG